MKTSFAEILSGYDAGIRRKFESKLPHWAHAGCSVPGTLALEQCSSEAAAMYKASFTSGFLCDITGGMGVDSWAFSKVCKRVIYNERDAGLAATAEKNFKLLGADNIECICREINTEVIIPQCDWIFIDPARRSASGRKVFLLEDCTPDINLLLPALRLCAPHIMIKLSPMADISMTAAKIGNDIKEIHIIGLGGEVKELLCILEKGFRGEYTITAADLDSGKKFSFKPSEEEAASISEDAAIHEGATLFEPAAILMKAGAFKLVGLPKLAKSTHLYIGETDIPGRSYRIIASLPLCKESFRTIHERWGEAEVTARNIPMTSEELKTRLKVKPGGKIHIFGVTARSGRVLIITEPLAKQHSCPEIVSGL